MRPQGGDLILIDVTRLIWRAWRGRHPTGIDRVCLAYLEHFQRRASAVIHRKGLSLILPQARSQRLFDLLLQGRRIPKASLILVLARALLEAHISPPERGMFYLNVGHTGLNDRALPEWISRKRIRAIHLIHDLIPITNPEFCRPGEAERHEVRLTNALLSASGIIANSKATLTELAAFAARKSISMPPSVVAWISGFETLRRPPAKTLDQPYFIAIGTIEARKNHLVLLQAWQRLVRKSGERAPMLVIVGQPGWEAEQVLAWLENLGELEGKVVHLRSCGDSELAAWIAGARALLMPSFAEGFGLPIVEALALGTPVLASNLPTFREIAGDLPTYLPSRDVHAWESLIEAFTGADPERERQLKRIGEYRAPTWDEHFRTVEDWMATLRANQSAMSA
jgi:glycosyltransferase involved in cell wall biosynthesis